MKKTKQESNQKLPTQSEQKTGGGFVELPRPVEPSSFVDVHSAAQAARERIKSAKNKK